MQTHKKLTYCFDIDGTLCTNSDGFYASHKPYEDRIKKVNELHKKGHKILLFTARGSTTGKDWSELTMQQLKKWKVQYDYLIFGKPDADIFIDDKGINDVLFFK